MSRISVRQWLALFSVFALVACGGSGGSTPGEKRIAAPTGLSSSSVTPTSVVLTWSPSVDAVTEQIIYDGTTKLASVGPTATRYSVTGLAPGSTHAFTVEALGASGLASGPSNVLQITTPTDTTPTDTTPPSAPTGLTAGDVTSSSVTLSWTASEDDVGVAGYDVYADGSAVPVDPALTSTRFELTGLTPSTTYSLTVRARDAAGNVSPASIAVTVTTAAPPTIPDTTPPSTPTGLSAGGVLPGSVTLVWGASADDVGVARYELYDGTTLTRSSTSNEATVTGLSPGSSHSFTVVAVDAAGNRSQASEALRFSAPYPSPQFAPTGFALRTVACSGVVLQWAASSEVGVIAYLVYSGGAPVVAVPGPGDGGLVTGTLSGLTPGTTYTFTVKAEDGAGNLSPASAALTVTLPACP